MKSARRVMFTLSTVVCLCALSAVAQDYAGAGAVEVAPTRSVGLWRVIRSGGPLGLLNWAGIFLWAFLGLPLGILSVVQSAGLRVRQYPVSTKLLVLGAVWVFVLGWVGVAHGLIGGFSMLGYGAPDVGLFALGISQALYSIAGALAVCQHYLFFLLISLIVIHFKHKRMLENG